MKAKGVKTIQVTANPVTTEIFRLYRGLDLVFKTCRLGTQKLKKTMYFLLSMSKHRVRNMIFSKDVVSQKYKGRIRTRYRLLHSGSGA